MNGCRGQVRFVESKYLEGQKRGVLVGNVIHVSPAILSLINGPERLEVLATLEILEAEQAPPEIKALFVPLTREGN